MQKRLFLLLFPMMFLPALVVLLVDWNTSRQHLTVLDSPGLTKSFDASLELARRVLEEEKLETLQLAELLASSISAGEKIVTSVSWWMVEKMTTEGGFPGTAPGKV